MASWDHEGIVELFRQAPELVAQLLERSLAVSVPRFSEARLEPASMTELQPAEIHADLVVVLRHEARPILGVVLEAQLEADAEKLFVWPAYLALLRRRLRCDVCLVVLTQRLRVARWASKPISLGPGCSLTPLVLSPSNVPAVSDVAQAKASPELAVLSAIVHGGSAPEIAVPIAIAAATAAHELDRDRFLLYFGLIHTTLSPASRKAFQMESERHLFFSEESRQQFDKGFDKGRAAEKAADVLIVLEARGLAVSDAQRARIVGTNDLELLGRWVRRAATVSAVEDLFD
jgi:hypothetical protein